MNITVEQYRNSISGSLSARQIEILKILYYLPNSSATAEELATALNYSSFRAASLQIGLIGKSISISSGIAPQSYENGRGTQLEYYTLVGLYERPKGWIMWKNLKKALRDLMLVTDNTNDTNVFERLPNELFAFEETEDFREGKAVQIFTNRYERNRDARTACIKYYGCKCLACGFDFGSFYGDFAQNFIHVHHKKQLSDIGQEYKVDPINDLIPLCANCHSAIHLVKPAMAIEELKKKITKAHRTARPFQR